MDAVKSALLSQCGPPKTLSPDVFRMFDCLVFPSAVALNDDTITKLRVLTLRKKKGQGVFTSFYQPAPGLFSPV